MDIPLLPSQSVRLGVKPLETHEEIFLFNWILAVIVLKEHLRREDGFVSYEYAWPSVKRTYRTYSVLLKILAFALYTSPLSVQALQSRCLSYASCATDHTENTALKSSIVEGASVAPAAWLPGCCLTTVAYSVSTTPTFSRHFTQHVISRYGWIIWGGGGEREMWGGK
jgi:hypothetical protein